MNKLVALIVTLLLALLAVFPVSAAPLKTTVVKSRLETASIAGLGTVKLRLDDTEAEAGPRYRATLSLECKDGKKIVDFAENEQLCDFVGLEHDEKAKKLLLKHKSFDPRSGVCGKLGTLEYDLSKACK